MNYLIFDVIIALILLFALWRGDSRGFILTLCGFLAIFVAFIGACIVCSSVTIRVEMRWVYVAYAAALLFFAYLSRVMGKAGILVLLYGCAVQRLIYSSRGTMIFLPERPLL